MALANTLALNGEKLAFIKANFFVNKMRQLIINDQVTYNQILYDIKQVTYLIVDDIGLYLIKKMLVLDFLIFLNILLIYFINDAFYIISFFNY